MLILNDCSEDGLMLDTYIEIDIDVINKVVKPYLNSNPTGSVMLGNIDCMKVIVHRMIVSLMDKYPLSMWYCSISNRKYLHPTLLRRTK